MRRLTSLAERAGDARVIASPLRLPPERKDAGIGDKTFRAAHAAWEMLAKIEDVLVEIPRHDPPHPHAEDLKKLNDAVRTAMMSLENLRAIAARSPLRDSVDERTSPTLDQGVVAQYKKEREEIEKQYSVRDGRISSPGKFEGEMVYVPYFWGHGLEGLADKDDGEMYTFRVMPEELAVFPELGKSKTVRLRERDDGFVMEV